MVQESTEGIAPVSDQEWKGSWYITLGFDGVYKPSRHDSSAPFGVVRFPTKEMAYQAIIDEWTENAKYITEKWLAPLKDIVVQVRPGGGPEDPQATLTLSISNLINEVKIRRAL